jgi:hypothetical protein
MEKVGCLDCTRENFGRRAFLRVGTLTFLGIGLRQYLEAASLIAAPSAKAKACILLWLEGGPSHIDTWDPKPSSAFRPISTSATGVQISELFPRVARHMDKLAIIRSLHTEELNHTEATYYAMTGHRPNPAMEFPSLGAIITKEVGARNEVPPHVLAPKWDNDAVTYERPFKAAFLGPEYDPLMLSDPNACTEPQSGACPATRDFVVPDLSLPKSISVERLGHRRSLLEVVDEAYREKVRRADHAAMDKFTEQALKMILAPSVKEAFDLSKEPDKMKDAYGRNGFGQSVLLARRLVEAGSRFVTAAGYPFNEWDRSHGDNDKNHRNQAPSLDRALSTLMEDLTQRGLLDSTVVIVTGEFGRTPHMNPRAGRDHWPHCWSMLLGGGGLRGGQVVGASDERGAYVADRMVTIGDVFATIYQAFGIDWRKEYMTPIGRPVKIANSIGDKTGEPIKELV